MGRVDGSSLPSPSFPRRHSGAGGKQPLAALRWVLTPRNVAQSAGFSPVPSVRQGAGGESAAKRRTRRGRNQSDGAAPAGSTWGRSCPAPLTSQGASGLVLAAGEGCPHPSACPKRMDSCRVPAGTWRPPQCQGAGWELQRGRLVPLAYDFWG